MSTPSDGRAGPWPTAEEAATFMGRFHGPRPTSRMQILTVEDADFLVALERENRAQRPRKSELLTAVEKSDIPAIEALLEAQQEDLKIDDLSALLLVACEECAEPNVARVLLSAGARVDCSSGLGDSALHLALYANHENVARALVAAGADIQKKGQLGRTPLHAAAVQNLESAAALLLSHGANIEAQDSGTWTPIHLACGFGSPEAQQVLIANGADVDYQDEDGWTALHQAASHNNVGNASLLLDAGAGIDTKTFDEGFSALQMAISYHQPEMVAFLLDSGAKCDERSSTGFTSLQLAVIADSDSLVRELARRLPMLVDQRSSDGSTALHMAAGRGLQNMVSLLQALGADPTLKDEEDLTPLQVATKFSHPGCILALTRDKPNDVQLPSLCSICKNSEVSSLFSDMFGLKSAKLGTYQSLLERSNCPVCYMVFHMVPSHGRIIVSADGSPPEITIYREGAAHLRLRVAFGEECIGYIEQDELAGDSSISQQLQRLALHSKYIASEGLDYSEIRDWVFECEEDHDAALFGAPAWMAHRQIDDIVLIDVHDQCVVSGTIRSKYVALSYVWGTVRSFQTTNVTYKTLERKGSLWDVDLPAVILNAMTFVERLGQRYLWVDAICIIQDDPAHKQKQLAQMDAIYSHAWLTLVALTAFDADSGLSGLFTDARALSRMTAYVDGHRWVSKPPEFDRIWNSSKYRTRAWTLQENILSARCLYVTNHRVYYSCHGTLKSEQSVAVSREESRTSNSVTWFADALGRARRDSMSSNSSEDGSTSRTEARPADWMHHFEIYSRLVGSCTSRNLSYPADVLRAILGPLMVLSVSLGSFSLAGLPEEYLDHALLWRHSEGGMKVRNEHFPTWSWAGWSCHSSYIDGPVFLGSTHDPVPIVSAVERFETYWQTSPKPILSRQVETMQTLRTTELQSSTDSTRPSAPPWSLDQVKERATAIQVLSFDAEMVQCAAFGISPVRPDLRMMGAPNPVCTLVNGDDQNCGVLYHDFDTIKTILEDAQESEISFIALSYTEAPEDSQDFFFDAAVFKRRPRCLVNVMLVKQLYNPINRAVERILQRDHAVPDRPVTQKCERIAIGQIHADEWERADSRLWHFTLS